MATVAQRLPAALNAPAMGAAAQTAVVSVHPIGMAATAPDMVAMSQAVVLMVNV